MLTATYNQVNARLQALRFRSNQDGEKWKSAMKEHEQMIEALQRATPRRCARCCWQHLHNKRDAVIGQLRRDVPAPAAAGAAR